MEHRSALRMDLIKKYFPEITDDQAIQFAQLPDLYEEWNAKINVVSRKDIEQLPTRHVLHSLAIAKFVKFRSNASILDLGTGGGFPGIPLAILYPNVNFTLIDGTAKKILVVNEVANALGLKNVKAMQYRAEEWKGEKFDYVVTRAVAKVAKLYEWAIPLIKRNHVHASPNGIIALKGGNLEAEILELPKKSYTELIPIDFFDDPFFDEKSIVYVQG